MGKNGGARPGAGRKPMAIEDDVKSAIKAALKDGDLDQIWAAVVEKCKYGSKDHITILFGYYYGKPKENLEQPTEMIINVVRKS